MKSLILAALMLAPCAAMAQTAIGPTAIHGCGTMAVTTSSAAVNAGNVTLCPNSVPFPTSGQVNPLSILVFSNSASTVILCPFGGTCAAVGRLIALGESVTKNIQINIATNPPSVIGTTGTATLYLEW